MGFFSSKQTSKTSSTMDNPMLQAYTAAYRGASPWGFASLDPEATLLAMGSGTSIGKGKDKVDLGAAGKKSLEGMSDLEKKDAEMANAALERIQQRQESGQFLTPQETEFVNTQLDKAFESSRKIAYDDWTRGTQMMAGSRGMRMSDTPIADPALRNLRDMELGFSSQRAGMGLDATMKLSGQQQMFDQQLADTLKTLQFNKWSTRQSHLFGGGLQAASQLGYKMTGKNTVTSGMSGLQKVMGTMGMIDAGMNLVGKGAMMGVGGAPGAAMGSGGASSLMSAGSGANMSWVNPGDFRMQGV